jgi:hypothetical protein
VRTNGWPSYIADLIDDESNLLVLDTKPKSTPVKTTWTMLLYLTSPATGCEGGQTVFYPDEDFQGRQTTLKEPIVVDLEVGMVLLHKHGNDCLLVSAFHKQDETTILMLGCSMREGKSGLVRNGSSDPIFV